MTAPVDNNAKKNIISALKSFWPVTLIMMIFTFLSSLDGTIEFAAYLNYAISIWREIIYGVFELPINFVLSLFDLPRIYVISPFPEVFFLLSGFLFSFRDYEFLSHPLFESYLSIPGRLRGDEQASKQNKVKMLADTSNTLKNRKNQHFIYKTLELIKILASFLFVLIIFGSITAVFIAPLAILTYFLFDNPTLWAVAISYILLICTTLGAKRSEQKDNMPYLSDDEFWLQLVAIFLRLSFLMCHLLVFSGFAVFLLNEVSSATLVTKMMNPINFWSLSLAFVFFALILVLIADEYIWPFFAIVFTLFALLIIFTLGLMVLDILYDNVVKPLNLWHNLLIIILIQFALITMIFEEPTTTFKPGFFQRGSIIFLVVTPSLIILGAFAIVIISEFLNYIIPPSQNFVDEALRRNSYTN